MMCTITNTASSGWTKLPLALVNAIMFVYIGTNNIIMFQYTIYTSTVILTCDVRQKRHVKLVDVHIQHVSVEYSIIIVLEDVD